MADVPGGNRLDVLPIFSLIQDAIQKHKAKKIFDSPEYQQHLGLLTGTRGQTGTGESQPNPGEMSPWLQKNAMNPYVGNALNEAIKARLGVLGGELTQAQTSGMKQQQGFAAGDVKALGGVTPAAYGAQTSRTATTEDVNKGVFSRDQLAKGGSYAEKTVGAPTLDAWSQLNQHQGNLNQKEAIGVTKEHGNAMAMNDLLKTLGTSFMDYTNLGQSRGDIISAVSSLPGMVGEVMKGMNRAQGTRSAADKALFEQLSGGGGPKAAPGVKPPPQGQVSNPYEEQGMINAWKRMYGATAPYPLDVSVPIIGGPGGLIEKYRGSLAPKLENSQQVSEQVTKTVAEINKHIGNLKTLDKTTTSGYGKFNQTASKVLSLASPLMTVVDQFDKMGLEKPAELTKMIEELTKLGINPRVQASQQGTAPVVPHLK